VANFEGDGWLSWTGWVSQLGRWVSRFSEKGGCVKGDGCLSLGRWVATASTESLWVRIQISLKTQTGDISKGCPHSLAHHKN
jgi:hypothetical protein